MRHAWLNRAGGKRLLVFFAGWGMDPHPFDFLRCPDIDVLMVFDYRDLSLPEEVVKSLDAYEERMLVAWSLGVAVANLCCTDVVNRFDVRAAINGTVHPVDSEEGIPPEIFDGTIQQLDGRGLARFIRRTCVHRDVHARYMLNPAQRPLAEIHEELQVLREMELSDVCVFTRALAGRDDRIFTYENQMRCWERKSVPCRTMDAPHFPFYAWASWEEVRHACCTG